MELSFSILEMDEEVRKELILEYIGEEIYKLAKMFEGRNGIGWALDPKEVRK